MTSIAEAAEEFLSHQRIAVTGVSRHGEDHGANLVYRRLKERGYETFAINPSADQVEGDPAYPSLAAVPGGVEAVVIGTRADRALATVKEAETLGIKDVWMHRSFGPGSVDDEAATYCREHGMTAIAGGCPLMFGRTADGGHRMMCTFMKLTGKVPRTV
ncbi:CoA-binding protein [Demequina salsinemoris]|uniref:CoA-binding protein n=1 Tax=Demequina salsinemoris TaxID=577470 RepID=UPI0007822FF1|nr:CoA-binding protein [Demequina salsinemoris]